jgi:hypothetical protein
VNATAASIVIAIVVCIAFAAPVCATDQMRLKDNSTPSAQEVGPSSGQEDGSAKSPRPSDSAKVRESPKSTELPPEIESNPAFHKFLQEDGDSITPQMLPFVLSSKRTAIDPRYPVNAGFNRTYSPEKQYGLNIDYSDPDADLRLYDPDEKKHFHIAECGTSCTLDGSAWIVKNEVFIYWGERWSNSGAECCFKFVVLVDLKTNLRETYTSKLVPPAERQ